MDFRNVLITILATSITAFIVAVFVFGGAGTKGVPATPQGYHVLLGPVESIKRVGAEIVAQVPIFFSSNPSTSSRIGLSPSKAENSDGIDELVETMNNFLEETQVLRRDEERYILIEKVSLYDDALDFALKATWDDERSDKESLLLMSRTTARHLALWNPFFYYVHPEAQAKIFPLTRKLEEEHNKLLRSLADADGHYAGEVATEDLEYYIEDIRKSAARRNSDFIRFSYEDYLRYREFFDELLESHPDFGFGLASSAHILFDDFYAMHEKVDLGYSDKTRGYIQDMRVELRDMHRQALLRFRESDENSALVALEKTLFVIRNELQSHSGWGNEIRDIIEDDYNFYNEIKNKWNN